MGRNNRWGVELTSVRFDQFLDPGVTPDPCYPPSSCKRESAPSQCQLTPNAVTGNLNAPSNIGITINITKNAPGAQYYNVYLNANGCDGVQDNFGWVGRFNAPGYVNGTPIGPFPNGTAWALGAAAPALPPAAGASLYDINDYCQLSPNPGNINAPCVGSQVTPGGVQFYFPNGSCFSQNSQGATYVYSGVQYNWIVIYAPASNTCDETLNGGASTQYIGTIYTPSANWTINGGDRSPLAGQVICYTAKVAGSGAAGIDFNPNYSPVPPAARLIN